MDEKFSSKTCKLGLKTELCLQRRNLPSKLELLEEGKVKLEIYEAHPEIRAKCGLITQMLLYQIYSFTFLCI
jgi:hypothetical protein